MGYRTGGRIYRLYTTCSGSHCGPGAFNKAPIAQPLAASYFGWNEVLIPFASYYRPIWMAFGIVALYLGIAIGISTSLRKRIGYVWWRRLHVLTLVIFLLTTVHGLFTGSDTQIWWGLSIYLVSTIAVSLLFCRRVFPAKDKRRHAVAHPVLAARNIAVAPQSNQRIQNDPRMAATRMTNQFHYLI